MIQPRNLARFANANWVFYDKSNAAILTLDKDTKAATFAAGVTITTGGFTVTAGDLAVTAGQLTFGAAASEVVPGATSLSFRNNADSADNLIITDAGAATLRAGLTVTAGGLTVTAGGGVITAGGLKVRGAAGNRFTEELAVTNVTTAGAATYTAAAIAGGIITRDPTGGNRTDVLPDAADIIAAAAGNLSADGDCITCYLINTADMAETITLGGAPTGITYANATQTIAQDEAVILLIRRTGATAATVYIIGA